MKLTVFTASIGKTDRLKEPTVVNPNVEYIAFVDNTWLIQHQKIRYFRSPFGPWRLVGVDAETDTIKQARRLKIMAHETLPGIDASLWIDAAYRLDCDPMDVMSIGIDAAALAHPDRNNIRDEGAELVKRRLATQEQIDWQLKEYTEAGWYVGTPSGLTTTGFLFRWHSKRLQAFNRVWWHEVDSHGHNRDQMSVDFAAFEAGVKIHYLPGHYRDNKFAKWFPHVK